MTVKIADDHLYHLASSFACGVLVPEPVMRKIAKIEAKFRIEVKRALLAAARDGQVFSFNWGLTYPEGKQTVFYYLDRDRTLAQAIDGAVERTIIEHRPLVFVADNRRDAQRMADEYYQSTKNEESKNDT